MSGNFLFKASTAEQAYQAGRDCALNGANTTNCHFTHFATSGTDGRMGERQGRRDGVTVSVTGRLTDEDLENAQTFLITIAEYCRQPGMAGLLTRYIEQGRPQCDETLAVVLPNLTKSEDMAKARLNLVCLCDIAEHLVAIGVLRTEMLENK